MLLQKTGEILMSKDIKCTVYKSLKKDETYVFIPTTSQLSDLPDELKSVLGETEKIMTLTITPEKKMARGTGADVIKSFEEQGFHLQMPEKPHINSIPSYGETLSEKKSRHS